MFCKKINNCFCTSIVHHIDYLPIENYDAAKPPEALVLNQGLTAWVYDEAKLAEITQARAVIALTQARQDKQAFGASVLARIVEINDSKNYTVEQLETLEADATLARIERHLWLGTLSTAKLLIENYNGAYYTTGEKAELVAMLDNYLGV